MPDVACPPLEFDQESSYGIRDDGALGIQNLIPAKAATLYAESVLEIGNICTCDLKKVNAFVRSQAVSMPNKVVNCVELFCCFRGGLWPGCTGNDPDHLILVFSQQIESFVGEFDLCNPELGSAKRTR